MVAPLLVVTPVDPLPVDDVEAAFPVEALVPPLPVDVVAAELPHPHAVEPVMQKQRKVSVRMAPSMPPHPGAFSALA